ncbi:MAG: DUF1552 domain-containing protein [Myxococcaceae bacterium]|nr:DUF1552 domain-containing protein [Myxococcaceae bacterium]
MLTKPLHRRTVLRGAGVVVALPFLEAMLPRFASAATSGAPQRFVAIMFPNGVVSSDTGENFHCTGSGAGYALSTALQPLAPYKEYVSPMLGLTNQGYLDLFNAEMTQSHWYAAPTFLTGQPIDWKGRFTGLRLARPGASVDQQIAATTNNPIKSLVMGVEPANGSDVQDAFFGQEHMATQISYSSQTTQPDRLDNSAKVFNMLFGATNGVVNPVMPPPGSDPGMMTRAKRRKSIVDAVKGDLDALSKKLGKRDKAKLDEYATTLSQLDAKVAAELAAENNTMMGGTDGGTVIQPGSCSTLADAGYTSDNNTQSGSLSARCRNMLDMMVVAFQCDLTRVSSLMLGNENTHVNLSNYTSVVGPHHEISHYAGRADLLDAMNTINTWQASQLAYLLGKLKSTSDAHGPLIENTLCLYGCGLRDGQNHDRDRIPLVLAGRGGGHLSGQLRDFGGANHANLLATISGAFGAAPSVGDSSGTLPGLF